MSRPKTPAWKRKAAADFAMLSTDARAAKAYGVHERTIRAWRSQFGLSKRSIKPPRPGARMRTDRGRDLVVMVRMINRGHAFIQEQTFLRGLP